MKRSREILRRISNTDSLKAAGLTDDEIAELSELKADYESQE